MNKRALPPPPAKGRKRTAYEIRADATRAALKAFGLKPFSFRRGRDCGRLIEFLCAKARRPLPAAKAGSYTDAAGAKRALERLGASSLPEFLDLHKARKPFSRILVGDIVQLEAEDGPFKELGALGIWQEDGTMAGYHSEAKGLVSMALLSEPVAVWDLMS